jgi:hypothetical protein
MKPYKMSDTPGKNVNAPKPVVAPLHGIAVVHSRKTGDALPDGSKDSMYEAQIPWPQPAADPKPFKNTK